LGYKEETKIMQEEDLVHLEGLVIGLSLPAACDILDSFLCPWRISEMEGKYSILTSDVNMQRFNLKVRDGKVFEVYRG
jgi:hypothetical protein